MLLILLFALPLVLGSNTRIFKIVFAEAQKKLQSVFGMELVELASRAGREQERQLAEDFKEELKAGRLRRMGKYIPSPLEDFASTHSITYSINSWYWVEDLHFAIDTLYAFARNDCFDGRRPSAARSGRS